MEVRQSDGQYADPSTATCASSASPAAAFTSPLLSVMGSSTARHVASSPCTQPTNPNEPLTLPPKPKSRFRVSFRSTISILSGFLIALACVFVWYIGYKNVQVTVQQLTDQQRKSILSLVVVTIEENLEKPVKAVNLLALLLHNRYSPSDFRNSTDLSVRPGFLADNDYVLRTLDKSYVQLVGYGTATGFYAHELREQSLVSLPYAVQVATNVTVEYCWQDYSVNATGVLSFFTDVEPSIDPLDLSQGSVAFYSGDQVRQVTGAPYRTLANFDPRVRPWYKAGVAAKGKIAWTSPYNLLAQRASITVVSSVQGITDPVTKEVVAVAYTISYLSHITALLQTLDIGANGVAVLIDSTLLLLASSRNEHAALQGVTTLDKSGDDMLTTIVKVFIENNVNLNSSTMDLTLPTNIGVTVDGDSYHLSCASIKIPGLQWVVVVMTYDEDWTGNIVATNRNTAILSGGILLASIICTLVVTFFMSLPLQRMTEFIRQFGVMSLAAGGMDEDGNQQKKVVIVHKQLIPSILKKKSKPAASSSTPKAGTTPSTLTKAHSLNGLSSPHRVIVKSETPESPDTSVDFDSLYRMWKAVMEEFDSEEDGELQQPPSPLKDGKSPGSKKKTNGVDLSVLQPRSQRCANPSLFCFHFMSEIDAMREAFGRMLLEAKNAHHQLHLQKQAKRQFIRYIFHEVRVPLNAMVLAAEHVKAMLTEHLLVPAVSASSINSALSSASAPATSSPPIRPTPANLEWVTSAHDMVAILQEQGAVMSRILNDVLCFQQIEDGALILELEPFDMEELIHSTVHTFSALFQDKRIEVTVEVNGMEQIEESFRREQAEKFFVPPSSRLPTIEASPPMPSERRLNAVNQHLRESSGDIELVGDASRIKTLLPQHRPQLSIRIPRSENSSFVQGAAPPVPAASSIGANVGSAPVTPVVPPHLQQQSNARWFAVGDRLRIRQVLANFISNAIKFVHDQDGKIIVRMEATLLPPAEDESESNRASNENSLSPDSHGIEIDNLIRRNSISQSHESDRRRAMFRLSVCDNGSGMTAAEVGRLFQKYSMAKADRSDKIRMGSSGLGLSICKNLTELFGGEIGCTSAPSVGSEFFLILPLDLILSTKVPEVRRSRSGTPVVPMTEPRYTNPSPLVPLSFSSVNASTHTPVGMFSHSPNTLSRRGSSRNSRNHMTDASCVGPQQASLVVPEVRFITEDDHSANTRSSSPSPNFHHEVPPPEPMFHVSLERAAPSAPIPAWVLPANTPSGPATPTDVCIVSLQSHQPAIHHRLSLHAAAQTQQQQLRPKGRILVVEDSVPNRKLLLMTLKSLGYEAEGLADGREAVTYFEQIKKAEEEEAASIEGNELANAAGPTFRLRDSIRCVLMDNQMPNLTGEEAARAIRTLGFENTIVGVTGSAMDSDIAAFLNAGANDLLTKPINRTKLMKLLQHYCPDASSAPNAPNSPR